MNATPEKIKEHIGKSGWVIFWRIPNERLLLQSKDRYSGAIIESFNNHPLHGLREESLAERFDAIVEQLENDEYIRPKRVRYSSRQTYKQSDLFIDDE